MSKSTQFLLYALFFTALIFGVLLLYAQYLAALLGVLTGGLRIWHFWTNREESEPFRAVPLSLPKKQRTPTQQQAVETAYHHYETKHHRSGLWRNPRLLLLGLAIGFVVIYFDRQMIFYTFFMSMLTTWMWFQTWLARRAGH